MFKRLSETLAAYQARDPAARSKLEIFLLYPGVHAILFHRVSHWLYRHRLFFLARLNSQIARHITGIEIHPAPGSAAASSSTTVWASSSERPQRSETMCSFTTALPWAALERTRGSGTPPLETAS